jgi:sortase A
MRWGMRRFARLASTLVVLMGLGALGWAALTWRWEDPFTGVYTQLQQRKLAERYDRQAADFARKRPVPPVAGAAVSIRDQARRYRRVTGEGAPMGRIAIPRVGLDMVVVNGTDADTLKRGPGRYLGSFMPGEGELVYLAGHRTTYSAPFSDIDALRPGDRVTLAVPYGRFEYRITRSVVVSATATDILRSRGNEVLALQSCHPRFFATHRYIAYAVPVAVTPTGARAPIPTRELELSAVGTARVN